MKLTEQQLAQMFKHSHKADISTKLETDCTLLYASLATSDKRLAAVEKIADDSHLSASYLIINQLHNWSQAIGTDIQLNIKPRFSTLLFSWLKPSLATAAILTTVYFISPQMDNEINMQQQVDRIMFTSSFEGNNNSDVIKSLSFDGNSAPIMHDVITRKNFS